MRKRILCLLCIGAIVMISVLYFACKEVAFPSLRDPQWFQEMEDEQQVTIAGQVWKKEKKKDTYILYLKNYRILNEQAAGERLLVYLVTDAKTPLPQIGQRVLIAGKVKLFQDAPNPGNFNQKFYYQKQNIQMAITNAKILQTGAKGNFFDRVKEKLWIVRQASSEWIQMTVGEKQGGILCAMLLGDNSMAESELKERYQKSGIGHLLAISGLHISFLGMGMFRLLRKTGICMWGAAFGGSLFLVLYVVMTGASVSAIRACVMFLIQMGAILTGREYDGLTALAAAAMVIIAKGPVTIFDAGFQLSFGAVLGICLIQPLLKRKKGIVRTIGISLSVQLAILPILLYYYFEMNPYSIVWNLIAVPLSGGVLGSGIAGVGCESVAWIMGRHVLADVLETISQVLVQISAVILWGYEMGSAWILKLPGAKLVIGQPHILQIVCYYLLLAVALLVLYKGSDQKRTKQQSICIVCMVLAFGIMLVPHGRSGQMEIVMLNVGQGDCFFIRGPSGGTYLIDGGSSTVSEVGKYRIEPFLKSQGVGSLDYVWISHGDADHVNGIEEMLNRQEVGVQVKHLVLPPKLCWDDRLTELAKTAQKQQISVYTVEQGMQFSEENMKFTCLWPKQEDESRVQGNEASMVLSVTFGQFDMLFTGDLEKNGEDMFIKYLKEQQKKNNLPHRYEILKAGHHGSRYATGEELLKDTMPGFAWISAGSGNLYGHPHEEVLERLANWEVRLYNTKYGSAVRLYTDGEKYYILVP